MYLFLTQFLRGALNSVKNICNSANSYLKKQMVMFLVSVGVESQSRGKLTLVQPRTQPLEGDPQQFPKVCSLELLFSEIWTKVMNKGFHVQIFYKIRNLF